MAEFPIDHTDVGDHTAVGVVDGVEDQCPRRPFGVPDRGGNLGDDLVQQLGNTDAGFRRNLEHLRLVAADDAGQFGGVFLRVRAGQVDLVEHRDDVKVGLQRQVQVGEGLRLDPLGRIDQQDGSLAGRQGPRDLVGEINVPGGVDHVEDVLNPVDAPRHPHRLRLDRDAPFAFDVHTVQVLRPHGALVHHLRQLQHPVGQRRFAVVDVRDDAEIADDRRIGPAGSGHSSSLGAGSGTSHLLTSGPLGTSPTRPGRAGPRFCAYPEAPLVWTVASSQRTHIPSNPD